MTLKWPPNWPWWDKHYYTDEWQHEALDPALGDERRGHNYNAIWGKTVGLDPGKSVTAISTQGFPMNVVMAFQLRFSESANGPFTATLPATGAFNGVTVKLMKSIDLKAGKAEETFDILPGFSQGVCTVICRQLSIALTAFGDNLQTLFIQVAACVVETVDCNDLAPNPPTPPGEPVLIEGYSGTISTRFDIASIVYPGNVTLLIPNPVRRQFFVQNYGDTDVGILFADGGAINWTPGSEHLSVVLPGGFSAVYESPVGCFRGRIFASTKPGGPTPVGFLLVTEGTP